MKNLTIYYVDSFTTKQFSGNPAAVCITESPLEDSLMQKIAAEINLSETAFLYPEGANYHLRWFTPEAEVSLCGHATLASAFTLWNEHIEKDDTISFRTLSGILTAKKRDDFIELNFPVEEVAACDFPSELVTAIGCKPLFTGRTAIRYFAEIEISKLYLSVSSSSSNEPGPLKLSGRSIRSVESPASIGGLSSLGGM
jgi:predicted PhzF superfamily epimerase YddE/YHI9